MEDNWAIKAYKIPLTLPPSAIALLDSCFEVKKRALDEVFKHVSFKEVVDPESGNKRTMAYLHFSNEKGRTLRNELLNGWQFAAHYVDGAIIDAIGLTNAWITLYNRGRAERKPEITMRTIYIKTTLFKIEDGALRITIKPREEYFVVDLRGFDWLPKDYDKIGGLRMTEDGLVITFKKNIEVKEVNGWVAFDVNLTNITS